MTDVIVPQTKSNLKDIAVRFTFGVLPMIAGGAMMVVEHFVTKTPDAGGLSILFGLLGSGLAQRNFKSRRDIVITGLTAAGLVAGASLAAGVVFAGFEIITAPSQHAEALREKFVAACRETNGTTLIPNDQPTLAVCVPKSAPSFDTRAPH